MYMYIQYIHVHVYRNAFNILQYIISYWLLRNQNLNYNVPVNARCPGSSGIQSRTNC